MSEADSASVNWHTDSEQRSMDATRQARLYREREPEGSEAIDARLQQDMISWTSITSLVDSGSNKKTHKNTSAMP